MLLPYSPPMLPMYSPPSSLKALLPLQARTVIFRPLKTTRHCTAAARVLETMRCSTTVRGRPVRVTHPLITPPNINPNTRCLSPAAARVLEKMRFSMTVRGRPVRVTHAVEPRCREHIFGSFGLRFQIMVKVSVF